MIGEMNQAVAGVQNSERWSRVRVIQVDDNGAVVTTSSRLQKRKVVSGSITYYMEAPLGTALTSASWRIWREDASVAGTTDTQYPIGANWPSDDFEFAASDYTVLNYGFIDDTTAPTLSTVTMASNNADTAWAKVGDIVTITIVASEWINAPTVTIAGRSATVTEGIDNLHFTAAITMASDDSAGALPFTIDFTDRGGNAGTQVTALTAGSAVTFDKTAPTMSNAARDSNTQITVTLSELAKASTITKANAGGFTVEETGTPATTYAVSAIAPWATNDLVVLTVADMTASAAAGVTVKYAAGGNGTVSDRAGNLLATDATGEIVAAW